jgi:ADP-heptose:LPS heptosyltransferase
VPSSVSTPPEGAAYLFPPEARRLSRALPQPYVFKSFWKRGATALLDGAGSLLLGSARSQPDWGAVRRIALLRLDHLGDLIQTLPALRRLKRALPKAQVDLWVGPWGLELARLFVDADTVRVTPAKWFQRGFRPAPPVIHGRVVPGMGRDNSGAWAQIDGLTEALRQGHYDASMDFRGDLRHHLAAWRAGIPVRLGFGLTGGRFFLSFAGRWDASLHEQEQNLGLLEQAGLPPAPQGSEPYLKLPAAALKQAAGVAGRLKLGRRPILIQAASGAQAKRWAPQAWAAVIDGLPKGMPVALLGSAQERGEMQGIARLCKRRVAVAAGELGLPGLAALLKRARLVLSVDSGPAHLAAVQGVPVLSLFSGTNRASQWAPRGPKVQVLQAPGIPCSPCELSVCPYGNACMQAIPPAAVLAAARQLLRAA